MMKAAAAMSACLLSIPLAALPARADIRVWSERDTQGEERHLRRVVRDLRHLDFDDTISSLRADEPWLVCSEPLFRGDCRVVEGTVANLRLLGMNNRISSMKPAPSPELPAPPPPLPVAPKRVAPQEPSAARSRPPIPSTPPDPQARDRAVPRPVEWWQGEGGAPVAAARDRGSRRGSMPLIEIFEKPRQRGHRIRLEGPIANVTDLGYPVRSLVVRDGSWQVCSLPSFQGDCRVVDASSETMANGMVIASLRPAP